MKHLPKHLQPRWRYLAVELEGWPDAEIEREEFQRALWYEAQNLLGDTGSAALDLSVVAFEYDGGTGEAVVRTRRGAVDDARAVITCLDAVDSQPIGVRVAGASGTVQACEEKYMGRRREHPDQRHVVFNGAERSAFVRDGRVDVRAGRAFTGATILDCH